jgi:hypothetical protein
MGAGKITEGICMIIIPNFEGKLFILFFAIGLLSSVTILKHAWWDYKNIRKQRE